MLDLHWFRDRRFSVASGGITLVFFAMFGTFFLITQYFQLVLGYTALEAGIKQLPVAAMMILVAPQTPRFSARFGANRVTGVGLGVRRGRPAGARHARGVDALRRGGDPDADDLGRHGPHHRPLHRLDHVGRPTLPGRRRLGHERHHP